MEIYERIYARLKELHMSQTELCRRTGIATSTISDWRKKKLIHRQISLCPYVRHLICLLLICFVMMKIRKKFKGRKTVK